MKKQANNKDKHTHMAELAYKTKKDENNLRRLEVSRHPYGKKFEGRNTIPGSSNTAEKKI
jgi:hypothetical protein